MSSEHTQQLIDEEVKRLTDVCDDEAQRTLSEHPAQLDRLAATLLARETLDEADAYAAAGIPAPPAGPGSATGGVPASGGPPAAVSPPGVAAAADGAPRGDVADVGQGWSRDDGRAAHDRVAGPPGR